MHLALSEPWITYEAYKPTPAYHMAIVHNIFRYRKSATSPSQSRSYQFHSKRHTLQIMLVWNRKESMNLFTIGLLM